MSDKPLVRIIWGAVEEDGPEQRVLLERLRALGARVDAVEIQAVYFVLCDKSLEPDASTSRVKLPEHLAREVNAKRAAEARARLASSQADASKYRRNDLLALLLQASDEPGMPTVGRRWIAAPRHGTISPWSDKATDILFHISALPAATRIERGRSVTLVGKFGHVPAAAIEALLFDRMIEELHPPDYDGVELFTPKLRRGARLDLSEDTRAALARANAQLGLALDNASLRHLSNCMEELGRPLTETELTMFAQINSEHCRHKIFNAAWRVDGKAIDKTLFDRIRATSKAAPDGLLIAYEDNAAAMEGATWRDQGRGKLLVTAYDDHAVERMHMGHAPGSREYQFLNEPTPWSMKVETHNHPTAISPFAGAATGAGGEIRDEAAIGRGGRPVAGLCGFTLSDLRLPKFPRPWETSAERPPGLASPLRIIIDGPLGAAAFNNEFGRPNLCGYFRTYERIADDRHLGYHKPIMIAGGCGKLRTAHLEKKPLKEGDWIVVIGGPAMLIGLGGGAASSRASGEGDAELDFASVQRGNPEMQRRCQEVIEQCIALGEDNPILAIHDVGAGGLSNAVPELLEQAGVGGAISLGSIPRADESMSAMELWCNESQERYVLAISSENMELFEQLCKHERCRMDGIGTVGGKMLELHDHEADVKPVSMPMSMLFDVPQNNIKEISLSDYASNEPPPATAAPTITLKDTAKRVLTLPAVASKHFLIAIGDRTVGGLTARDQMVGPWQAPVADCAICLNDHRGHTGAAMAMGERSPVAVLDPAASVRLAISEALTNILAASLDAPGDARLSANWMAACGDPAEDAALYAGVVAAEELCVALGVAIPVGKDSLSMRARWDDKQVISPLSLIVSAFAPVRDARLTLTPALDPSPDATLYLLDLSNGKNRLGGSALMHTLSRDGGAPADLDDPAHLKGLFEVMRALRKENAVTAWHDRSDGGLWVTLCEMAFAGRCGLNLQLDACGSDLIAALFAEEPGGVVQLANDKAEKQLQDLAKQHGIRAVRLGAPTHTLNISIQHSQQQHCFDLMKLKKVWWETGFQIQSLRDNPECAREERDAACDPDDPGLSAEYDFKPELAARTRSKMDTRPRVAILREQGVNGHMEMAAAFDRAGFRAIDLHMNNLHMSYLHPVALGPSLEEFDMLAVCGGFSFGDVLGAGAGWSASVLFNNARKQFRDFFHRDNTLTLGVCNGCQMLSHIKSLIPGTDHWPTFKRNRSERFEARWSRVEVLKSPSVLLQGMVGAKLPIVVAHGEGRATSDAKACLRYVDNHGNPATRYPDNPNGSPGGATGFCSEDGRATIMMPHPERVFRGIHHSWRRTYSDESPWLRMFINARRWLDERRG